MSRRTGIRRRARAWWFRLAATCLCASPAMADQCAPRQVMVGALASQYGETRHGMGLVSDQSVVELWINEATGTWTATYTDPAGQSCIAASGEAWQVRSDPLPPEGQPG